MTSLADLQLIQQIEYGDEEALVTLHQRYANLVYSVAYSVLGDSMAAEEVTQDTFMRLWDKADTFDAQRGRFTVWLLTITRRLAIDALRKRQRREPQQGLFLAGEYPDLWNEVLAADSDSGELRQTLLVVMERLPDEQRRAIELAYFYSMSHNDISETLGIPLGTVKGRIRQGMQKLRVAWMEGRPINPNRDDST